MADQTPDPQAQPAAAPAAQPVTLDSIRQKYPQYDHVPDDQLAHALHDKFYSQVPFEQFADKIGYKPQPSALDYAEAPGAAAAGLVGGAWNAGVKAVSGYAGLAGAALPGPPGQGAAWQQGVEHAGTIDLPQNRALSAAGEKIKEIGSTPSPLTRGVDALAASGPGAQTAVEGATQAIPAVAGALTGLRGGPTAAEAQEATAAQSAAAARAEAMPKPKSLAYTASSDLKALGQEGYQAGPTELQGTNPSSKVPGQTAEKLAGPDLELGKRQLNNQVQSTRLGGQVLGKTNAHSITEEDVTRANVAPGATYDDAGTKVGTFKPSDSFANTVANIKDDPIAGQAGVAKMLKQVTGGEQLDGPTFVKVLNEVRQRGAYDLSNAMADELEHQLTAKYGAEGSKAILDNLADARQQFARNYLVRDSLKGGQVDASVVNRWDKANPGKLDGELKTISSAADALPESSKMPQTTTGAISAASPHQMHIPIVGPMYNAVQHAGGRLFMPSQKSLMGSTPNPAAPTPPHGGPLQIAPLPPQAPPPLSLEHPPGAAYTPAQRPLSGPYEPNRNPMARAEWDRQVLARARAARAHGEGQ